MFIQFIKARVKDEQAMRDAMDRWDRDLKPGAEGYLGTTAGVCSDGTLIALARFESEEAAMRNSERPEQGEWWTQMQEAIDGEAEFTNLSDVELWLDGGSDDAGFVQVMTGHSPDPARLRETDNDAQMLELLRKMRPEIIGGTFGTFGDGGYVQTAYFRSEDAAREHESMEPPEEIRQNLEERMRLMGEVNYYDLHEPILRSR